MISPAAPQQPSEPQQPALSPVSSTRTCQTCGREATPKSKFCIYCGGQLSTVTQSTKVLEGAPSKPVTAVKPIPVPAKVLASLMARGRQLALEEEYVKNGTESDELLEELSQAASDSDFELEELIDTYINERSELERLESLHKKGEVSERVFDRLVKEYEVKLTRMDEQIIEGITQLQSYKARIQLDHAEAKEELDTLKTRHLIGDDETKGTSDKDKVSEKTTRLNYAFIACEYILKKESAMRNGPITRFEITETTVADSKVTSTESEDVKVIKTEEKVEEEPKEEAKDSESTSSQSAEDSESGKICSQCGRLTASDAKFCIHCAASL
jgi:RNA polymerase subunit RPABC4/transcription elongation factor Spt4